MCVCVCVCVRACRTMRCGLHSNKSEYYRRHGHSQRPFTAQSLLLTFTAIYSLAIGVGIMFESVSLSVCLSAASTDLVVPATRRSTIGDRAFAVAGTRAWNSLPPAVRSSATYNIFKKDLNNHRPSILQNHGRRWLLVSLCSSGCQAFNKNRPQSCVSGESGRAENLTL